MEQAIAEIVELKCPACGRRFRHGGTEPEDRKGYAGCPECGASTAEYGDWVVGVHAVLYLNRVVTMAATLDF